MNHDNRPIVALWGYTVRDDAPVEELEELIEFFHNNEDSKYNASIKLGVNDNFWQKGTSWSNALEQVEVISPWSVGRFGTQSGYNSYENNQLKPGKAWCEQRGILYVPVVFPGFGWYNLRNGNSPMNHIPREGGNFFWLQAYGAVKNNVESVYFAMLDEVDESTAFFKTAENSSQAPAQENWLNLDADGYDLPSDWYLRCAGQAAEMLRGNFDLTSTLGTPDEGIMSILPGISDCKMTFLFPKHDDVSILEISIDGGDSFPYSVANDAGGFEIDNLDKGTYNVFVRDTYSVGEPVPMGKIVISGDCVNTSAKKLNEVSALNSINIYPIPTNANINIQGLSGKTKIQIVDVFGNICKSAVTIERNHSIDISDLPNAIYFVSINNNFGTITRKITKCN